MDESKKENSRDLNDLTRSVLYTEIPNQNLIQLTAIIISLGFAAFIAWSSFTHVNEVARIKGEILPSGYAQVVQHLEGGIISEILVEEGDLVEEGQVLLRMSGIGAEEDFASLRERQLTLELQAERLRAIAYGKEPNFLTIQSENDDAVAYQKHLLETAKQAFNFEKKVLQDQISQKQDTLERFKSEEETAKKELASGKEILQMKEKLQDKGSVSKKDLIDTQRDVTRLEGNMRSASMQILEAEKAISEYENRLQTLEAKTKDKALKELEEVVTQIAENKEILGKLENRVHRQMVRSPVRGLVQGLRVNTIGGVVGAGQPLMEIVPLDHTLIVEAKIPPREVGNLKVGQPARVKVSAFDFSRYGVIEGELAFISATTFMDERNESFYKGRIQLNQDYVGLHPDKNIILPGMTIEADIITGEKTIMAYLLKPIRTSLDAAFRER